MHKKLSAAAHLLHSKAEVVAISPFSDTDTSRTTKKAENCLKSHPHHLGGSSQPASHMASSVPIPAAPRSNLRKDRTNEVREIRSLSDYRGCAARAALRGTGVSAWPWELLPPASVTLNHNQYLCKVVLIRLRTVLLQSLCYLRSPRFTAWHHCSASAPCPGGGTPKPSPSCPPASHHPPWPGVHKEKLGKRFSFPSHTNCLQKGPAAVTRWPCSGETARTYCCFFLKKS